MRIALALLLLPLASAGCLDSDGEGPGGLLGAHQPVGHREPWVVLDQGFSTTNVGSQGTLPFRLDQDASQLQVAIQYGPSAFSGFRFTSPDACVEASPGFAFFANSGESSGMCGPLAKGDHALVWTLDAGSINSGRIVLVAIP